MDKDNRLKSLRPDHEKSLGTRKNFCAPWKESTDHIIESTDHIKESKDHIIESTDHIKESKDHIIESTDHIKESTDHIIGLQTLKAESWTIKAESTDYKQSLWTINSPAGQQRKVQQMIDDEVDNRKSSVFHQRVYVSSPNYQPPMQPPPPGGRSPIALESESGRDIQSRRRRQRTQWRGWHGLWWNGIRKY